jgi:hypothetical protein
MSRRRILLTSLVISPLLLWLPMAGAQDSPALEPAIDREAGLADWEEIHAVFAHPRCANCHVEDDNPRWSGAHYGQTRVHAFNVRRGEDGFGSPAMQCSACHSEDNSPILHGPPGAPHWHLAPAEMAWFDRSSAEICAQIKDPGRNGDRTLDEVAEHVRDDALVGWGWQPGTGREPAPGSADELFEAIERWAANGAPCPQE